ncbi:MAG: restriction endonuclease [Candidatus Levybacteria bacterium]|nr:restriction endonuclease [Candidatus Levybacteria bacterium]
MIHVIKADGTKEQYSEEKVKNSIKRAGLSEALSQKVLKAVHEKLYDEIPTYDIYGIIAQALSDSEEPHSKSKYSLKQAIMMLGPTGFPFEDFIGKILSELGYTTKTREVLDGRCVTHEVDVSAEKNGKKYLVEAKFHNNPGSRSEIQVALYVKSRFEDLKDRYKFEEAWIVTNTKATIDAKTYAGCSGMKIISWDYPEQGSLRDMIESSNLHPVTLLSTLNTAQKARLLANHIVLCKDLDKASLIETLGLSPEEIKETLDELAYICRR